MHESTKSFAETETAEHIWERCSVHPDDDHLLWHTQNWLNAMPKGVRPVQLPVTFPRIANDLSRLWPETAALDLYFEEKEFSPRQDRIGFTPLIKEELLAMHVYSLRSRPISYEQRAPQHASLLG